LGGKKRVKILAFQVKSYHNLKESWAAGKWKREFPSPVNYEGSLTNKKSKIGAEGAHGGMQEIKKVPLENHEKALPRWQAKTWRKTDLAAQKPQKNLWKKERSGPGVLLEGSSGREARKRPQCSGGYGRGPSSVRCREEYEQRFDGAAHGTTVEWDQSEGEKRREDAALRHGTISRAQYGDGEKHYPAGSTVGSVAQRDQAKA